MFYVIYSLVKILEDNLRTGIMHRYYTGIDTGMIQVLISTYVGHLY